MKMPGKLLALLLVLCSARAFAATGDLSYSLPILTVRGNSGCFERIPLEYRKKPGKAPLRISISDDSPNGSGNSIRSSVWQAAVTAATQRNNLMSGVRVGIEFSGNVDGPSAGSIICLGIMSAMDGRKFPMDFAMTGTIMPDGTVGLVGGVALKMRAAAQGGIKRICIPAFQRFETQSDGTRIDLFNEARKLGMEVYPVEHINEAYAVLHKLPPPSLPQFYEREAFYLLQASEEELIKLYNHYQPLVKREVGNFSSDDIKRMREFEIFELFQPQEAENLFRSGKLLPAVEKIFLNYVICSARKKVYEFAQHLVDDDHEIFAQLNSKSRLERLQAVIEYNKLYLNKLNEYKNKIYNSNNQEFFSDNDRLSEISAQLESTLGMSTVIGKLYSLDRMITYSMENFSDMLKEDSLADDDFDERLKILINFVDIKSMILNAMIEYYTLEAPSRVALAGSLPQIRANSQAGEVERLFHYGWLATHNSIEATILSEIGEQKHCSLDRAADFLANADEYCAVYYLCRPVCMVMHMNLDNSDMKLKNPAYHLTASTVASSDMFAKASAILIKYGPELGAKKDANGNFQYHNTTFLNYLLRTARTQALQSIVECQKLQIPCVDAIRHFQTADINREKVGTDKIHEVLELYWTAGLEAKALILSFQKEPAAAR